MYYENAKWPDKSGISLTFFVIFLIDETKLFECRLALKSENLVSAKKTSFMCLTNLKRTWNMRIRREEAEGSRGRTAHISYSFSGKNAHVMRRTASIPCVCFVACGQQSYTDRMECQLWLRLDAWHADSETFYHRTAHRDVERPRNGVRPLLICSICTFSKRQFYITRNFTPNIVRHEEWKFLAIPDLEIEKRSWRGRLIQRQVGW